MSNKNGNHCYPGIAISITYSECVSVALVILPAMRMRRVILPAVACLALPYFSTLRWATNFKIFFGSVMNMLLIYLFASMKLEKGYEKRLLVSSFKVMLPL